MKKINRILLIALAGIWVACDTTPEVGPTAPEFVTFSGSSTVSIFENAGSETLTVITSAKEGAMVTVTSSSEDAVEGVDYTISATTVEIAEDVYESSFDFTVIDNFQEDGNKTVTVSLESDGVKLGGASSVVITIVDNDCAYDRTLIDGVLVGTDSRPFNGQQFASIAEFSYVDETTLQAININTPWMEGYWDEVVDIAYTVDIDVDPELLSLTIAKQPIMETTYQAAPYSYYIIGTGTIDTCGEVMTISYMIYNAATDAALRSSNFTLTVALPQPSL